MTPQEIAQVLEQQFGDKVTGKDLETHDPWVAVAAPALREVARFCLDDDRLKLDYLRNLHVVDWLITDPKKAEKLAVEPHLEVLYHLYSLKHRHQITLKVMLERWKDGQEGVLPEVPSLATVWKIAEWHEREAYDLSGIRFLDHPNLHRLLCPDDWVGHPLRKDYVFPKEYHGIPC